MLPKTLRLTLNAVSAGTLLGMPALASAHGLHGEGATMLSGLAHPFSGLDHLLVLLVTGIWSAHATSTHRRAAPLLLFLGAMLAGLASGVAARNLGYLQPGVGWLESGLAASVMAAGLLLAFAPRLPVAAGMAVVAALALLHGLAHGIESPSGSPGSWAFGVLAGSAVLLCAGQLLGARLQVHAGRDGLRVAGAASALAGLALLA